MNNYCSSFALRFPNGPLNLPRLSETPYLLSKLLDYLKRTDVAASVSYTHLTLPTILLV